MAIDIVRLSGKDVFGGNTIITPTWTFTNTRVQEGQKYLNDEMFTVTRKDGEQFTVKFREFINTVAEYFKAQAKEFKSEDTKENITNNLQARFFKTGLIASLGYTGKYGLESSTLPKWLELLQSGKFAITAGRKFYYFKYLVDENGQKYLEWALTKPAEFYKKHLDAMLDEKTPPDTGGDEEETQTYYIYLVLFILAIFLIFSK